MDGWMDGLVRKRTDNYFDRFRSDLFKFFFVGVFTFHVFCFSAKFTFSMTTALLQQTWIDFSKVKDIVHL